MSDLISRSALLKKFDDTGIQITFDLPVEEILGDNVDIDDFTMLVQDAIQAYKNMVMGTIKEQPTAYNPEKVVEELERMAQERLELYDWQGQSAYEDAIEIVRKGGAE